jgi:hypothetical protein
MCRGLPLLLRAIWIVPLSGLHGLGRKIMQPSSPFLKTAMYLILRNNGSSERRKWRKNLRPMDMSLNEYTLILTRSLTDAVNTGSQLAGMVVASLPLAWSLKSTAETKANSPYLFFVLYFGFTFRIFFKPYSEPKLILRKSNP